MRERGNMEVLTAEAEELRLPPAEREPEPQVLRASATKLAGSLTWVPGKKESSVLSDRCRALSSVFKPLFTAVESQPAKSVSGDFLLFHHAAFLLEAELEDICGNFKQAVELPKVRTPRGEVVPRVVAVAEDYLASAEDQFSEAGFTSYVQALQEIQALKMVELWTLIPILKLVLLEKIGERGRLLLQDPAGSNSIRSEVRSLQDIKQTTWKTVIEPLIAFDQVLKQDPAGAYPRMDYESRDLYRNRVVELADHSDCSELDVAREVLALARAAQRAPDNDPRVTRRASHVGSYLLAEGKPVLEKKLGFRAPGGEKVRTWVRTHPDEFYLPGIAVLTLAIVSLVVFLLTAPADSMASTLLAILAVTLPGSQAAVQIMNYLATLLLPAQILPKLDLSEGLPEDCTTIVAIPTLLLNEKQVRELVEALEVRFLGNHDPNLHFLLLSDLPDAAEEPDEENVLVDLCSELITGLNAKYKGKRMGSFFMLHRHPVYNPHEGFWMGWERKRGKLMDLNNLLRGQFDSFPVKLGDLSILPKVRYVITLDSDTELPRGSARRMVGALAHPLNQAVIDREKGTVVKGYGILQPRVGVSVLSSARSRLASIYSGQTGIDIYSRAASDVYQDLYGEGIFVGKGIYEVDTLHQVLDRRFPRNALLSHDLMEGAYARAGLVSDVEVIEDYPSHYSAYNKRKHRWLRGDWQITEWLLPQVPEESGQRVPNPLSVVSRWKILDNLRRSLVEPAFFVLLVLGWTVLPGAPWAWTLAAVGIVFLPALFQLAFDLVRAAIAGKAAAVVGGLNGFADAAIANLLTITFLAHQALLSLDAVVRTMVRRLVTRQRLLQWESAAETELNGNKRTTLDVYLKWTPALVAGLFLLVWAIRREAIYVALPILILWAFSNSIAMWLNRPSRGPRKQTSERNLWMLRLSALRTWRYFAEFSTEEHHWLIPDNVQEVDRKVAARISPTNVGFLLNARQAACEFGYLTVPEFVQQTLHTLNTMSRMERYRGHLFNWYDTQSLQPLPPNFVSSVDSGNLVASLWTLQQGCLDLLSRPLLQPGLPYGFLDHLYFLTSLRALPRRTFTASENPLQREDWLRYFLDVPDDLLKDLREAAAHPKFGAEAGWYQAQAEERIRQISRVAQTCAPWLLPEFALLRTDAAIYPQRDLPGLQEMADFIDKLGARLKSLVDAGGKTGSASLAQQLILLLPDARSRVARLIEDLNQIASRASEFADEMNFDFLEQPSRKLLSVGLDAGTGELNSACYDLLASESRIALFISVAKDDLLQESWFSLGRPMMVEEGMAGMLSWTGTMFEYLMPALWMRTYPNTLLERASYAAVRVQRAYAANKRIPWGISEAAYSRTDECGNYQYHAFGVPQLAIHKGDQEGPVVSPYSTFLALESDSGAAIQNLRKLQKMKAVGTYGFYESLDFNPARRKSRLRRYELVRCWMAHHQGMSLLATANFLHGKVLQRWFHSHPRVQATELLLQEKPAAQLPRVQAA